MTHIPVREGECQVCEDCLHVSREIVSASPKACCRLRERLALLEDRVAKRPLVPPHLTVFKELKSNP